MAADLALLSLEASLEAWATCKPDGYTLRESKIPPNLPQIACLVPGSSEDRYAAEMLMEMFIPASSEAGIPVFQQMLKPQNGVVHFLYFWRAFSKAAHVLASSKEGSRGSQLKGLGLELETVRDEVLRLLEADASKAALTISDLAIVVARTSFMSGAPEFWGKAQLVLNDMVGELDLHSLTTLFISWLHDAIAWQHGELTAAVPRPKLELCPKMSPEKTEAQMLPAEKSRRRRASSFGSIVSKRKTTRRHDAERSSHNLNGQRLPVFLHIYDVSQESSVHRLNKVLAHRKAPLKFGGIFHAGVEVNGLEFGFGMSESETMSGITCVIPRTHPQHRYRQTVSLGSTKLSDQDVAALISELIEEYAGPDYDLLRRNCCHFADDFCRRLGVGGIPGWVHRLARVGAMVDSAMHAVTKRRLLGDEMDEYVQ